VEVLVVGAAAQVVRMRLRAPDLARIDDHGPIYSSTQFLVLLSKPHQK
jgi:hypothetical protein